MHRRIAPLLLFLLLSSAVYAQERDDDCASSSTQVGVVSFANLPSAVSNASPSTCIRLADGTYTSPLVLNGNGTSGNPIVVKAETLGGVKFGNGATLVIKGNYVTVAGFDFDGGAYSPTVNVIQFEGTNNRLTNSKVGNLTSTAGGATYDNSVRWIYVTGHDHRIDHNEIYNKSDFKPFIGFGISTTVDSTGHRVDHNWIHDYPPKGSGGEGLRFGSGGTGLGNIIIEDNLIERLRGETEGFSVKASNVTVRNNTLVDFSGSVTFRAGTGHVFTGNITIVTPAFNNTFAGTRVYGANAVIQNNHQSGGTNGIVLGAGEPGDPTTACYAPTLDTTLSGNRFTGVGTNIVSSYRLGQAPSGCGTLSVATTYLVNTDNSGAANISGAYTPTSPEIGVLWTAGDTTDPTDPSNLVAAVVSSNQIDLSWTGSTDDSGTIDHYNVEICDGSECSDFAVIGTPSDTTFSATGLTAETLYRFRVQAADPTGNTSGYSNIDEDTTSALEYDLTTGRIGYWNFDETTGTTAADAATGDGAQDGTITGGVSLDEIGQIGGAFGFDGSTGYIVAPSAAINLNTGSVALWARPGFATFPAVGKFFIDTDGARHAFYISNDSVSMFNDGLATEFGNVSFIADTWHHFVFVYQKGGAEPHILYFDGVKQTLTTQSGTWGSTALGTNLYIGSRFNQTEFFDGDIDEVYSFNRVLAQDDVTALHQLLLDEDNEPPSIPIGLQLEVISASQVDATWNASTDNDAVAGYRVERCNGADCVDFAEVGSLASTSFSDTTVAPNTLYRYCIKAEDLTGNLSDCSGIAEATTPLSLPDPPTSPSTTAANPTFLSAPEGPSTTASSLTSPGVPTGLSTTTGNPTFPSVPTGASTTP